MPAIKESERIYLREEERSFLQSMLQERTDQLDKKSWNAFVSGSVLPRIQELNGQEYGPDINQQGGQGAVGKKNCCESLQIFHLIPTL